MITNSKALDAKLLNTDELATAILRECKKAVGKAGLKYGYDRVTDLEGFLVTEIWAELAKKDVSFHSVIMVRRLIGLRTVDFIREQVRFNNQTKFSVLEDGESEDSFESQIPDTYDFELDTSLKAFRDSLTYKMRQILDLTTAGYGNNEICEMVGCSINTPKNTMKKIKELAMQFGL